MPYRFRVLVGDAPPHLDYAQGPRPEALIAEARAQRIVVDALGCRSLSSSGRAFFRRFAYATEGRYQHIGHVDLETGGMTASMLASLAKAAPLPEASVGATRVEDRPEAELIEARWLKPGCTFALDLPSGARLAAAPTVLADSERVVVQVPMAAEGQPGGVYALETCVPGARLQLRMEAQR